jgi:hypothetical protein
MVVVKKWSPLIWFDDLGLYTDFTKASMKTEICQFIFRSSWCDGHIRMNSEYTVIVTCKIFRPDLLWVFKAWFVFLSFLVEWNRVHHYWGHYWPIVPTPDDDGWWWDWSSRWNDWQGKLKYSEKTCYSAALSTRYPPWPDKGSNLAATVGSQWLTAWATARPKALN